MTEQQPDPPIDAEAPEVEEWDPLATLDVVRLPVPSSGGRAAVFVRRWSGAERLAYENGLAGRYLGPSDGEDGDTILLATMRQAGTAITLRGSEGFPERADGTPMFSSPNPRERERDLERLSAPVYAEVRDLVLRFQPLPVARAAVDDLSDPELDDGEGEGDNPFPTPSTPATAAQEPDAAT